MTTEDVARVNRLARLSILALTAIGAVITSVIAGVWILMNDIEDIDL